MKIILRLTRVVYEAPCPLWGLPRLKIQGTWWSTQVSTESA